MNPDIFGWLGTGLVLLGVYRISQHNKIGFLQCVAGDIFLASQGAILGMTSLIMLNVVLLCLHMNGFRNWSKMGI